MEVLHSFSRTIWAYIRQKIQARSEEITRLLDDGKQKHAIAVLDGVRGIACLAIVTFHMNLLARLHGIWHPALDNVGAFLSADLLFGESGVILFFVLSGFLLFLPYVRAMLFDHPWPSARRFYIRRIFRILPGYYGALFLMVLFLQPDYLQPQHWYAIWLFVTFRMDFPLTFQLINAPFWTLALEFQYYMVLPLFAWIMGLIVRRGTLAWRILKLTACLFVLLLWGLSTRYWGLFSGNFGPLRSLLPGGVQDQIKLYTFGSIGKYYEVFAIGMLVCMVYVYGQHASSAQRVAAHMRRLSPFLFLSGLMILTFLNLWHFYLLYMGMTLHFFDAYQAFLLTYKEFLMPVCYASGYGLCILALVHGTSWLKHPFEWMPLRWLGWISYSLYMWHYPIILFFLNYYLPKFQRLNWSPFVQGGIYWFWIAVIALPLAMILYRVIEIPGMRRGERICHWLECHRRERAIAQNSFVTEEIPVSSTSEVASLRHTQP